MEIKYASAGFQLKCPETGHTISVDISHFIARTGNPLDGAGQLTVSWHDGNGVTKQTEVPFQDLIKWVNESSCDNCGHMLRQVGSGFTACDCTE